MSTTSRQSKDALTPPELHDGDRMTREQFHIAYERMPAGYRAELIAGVVHEPSPVSYSHSKHDGELGLVLGAYAKGTPGVDFAGHNATLLLSDADELQPDLILRIDAKYGGRSQITADDYIAGAPELVAEIAVSSEAIDLHLKKERYAQAGVLEYVVVCLRPKKVRWFHLQARKELAPTSAGVFHSRMFPGLWIDGDALLRLDYDGMMRTLELGLRSTEHKKFLAHLAKHARG
jgi:Uma2 family endonuclease